MPALDYGTISQLSPPQPPPQQQTSTTDTSSVDQQSFQQLPQVNLPQVSLPPTDLQEPIGVADFFRKRGDAPITSDNDDRLSTVSAGGQNWRVHREAAPYFQGFLEDLGAAGAPLRSDGGWVYREKVGARGISGHAFGGAIDVNQDGRNEVSPEFQKWIQDNPGALETTERRWHIYGGERFGDLGHFEWGGVPMSEDELTAARSARSQQGGQQMPLTIPPIVYPWQAMDPASVTLGDVMQQQQQRETGNIVTVNTSAPGADPAGLDAQLGGVLSGHGADFVAAGQKYGVDPRLIAAISMFETGNGTSDKAKNLNNVAGIYDSSTNQYRKFDSVGDSIDFVTRNIRQRYLDQGLDTIPKIAGQYAPVGAANDPNKTNDQWPGAVSKFYSQLGGNPGSSLVSPVGQQQQAIVPQITYPWQSQTAAVNQDQINQAIQQALQRNAFASTQPGVPVGYNASNQATAQSQQKVGLVLSQAGDVQAKLKPESYGMRVGTLDDVKAYDSAVASGLDPNTIDPYDRLAVALAKNPGLLLDPKNAHLLDEMVVQPQKAANAQVPLGEKIYNAVNAGIAGIGDMGNSIAALARAGWKDAGPAVRALAEKMSGQTPDPEALAGTADLAALTAQGVGKTVSDTHNLLSQIGLTAVNGSLDLASMLTNDPQKLQQLHMQKLYNMQNLASQQQVSADLGANLQGLMANAYSATGVFADLGQKLKTAQADPQAVEGISQLAQLLAPGALEGLAGMKVTGAFKPLLAERALEATTDVAEARARKFFFDSAQAVPRDVEAEAANPNYFNVRNAQANLAPDARAADANFQQQSANLQQQLTSLNRISADPGTPTQFAQGVLNATGNAIGAAGDAMGKLNGLGDRWLNTLSLGSPTLRGLYDKMFRAAAYAVPALMGHGWAARLAEYGVDALEHVDAIPKAASGLRDFFKTLGQEAAYGETSVPYWTRVSQGNRLVSPRMAAFLDSPAVQTIAKGVMGAPGGMATGAFIGALSDPNDPVSGAIENAIPGGLFGMVGGGFGQWQRYNSPGEVYMKARGDWRRTLDTMAGTDRDRFLSLQPKDQLMLSTYLQQVPGLRVNFMHDPAGPEGSFDPHIHTFDTADKPMITVNLANPEGTVRGIFSHELMHATQSAGMTPDIYDALLGNVDRGTPGQYTATKPAQEYFVPSKGYQDVPDWAAIPPGAEIKLNPNTGLRQARWDEPPGPEKVFNQRTKSYQSVTPPTDAGTVPVGVDPATSRYVTNQEFQNFKNSYVTSLARSGQPTAHLSDLDIARELFAEHGVDYLLSAKGAVDATSAFRPGWVNRNMLKNAYAKLGFVFDRQGNMVHGTRLFDNVRANDAVDKLTQKYFQTQFRERSINSEEMPTRKWTMEDLRSTNAADTFLNTAPEIMRNPDGSVMRDSRGMPLMRTPAQVKAYNAKLANDTLDRINALPEERKADIGYRILPNGNVFVRYLPQELRDALSKTNEYNPHQITALNALSEQLADKTRMGTNFRLFYHTALSERKRYGSFSGTEKFAVPYGFTISKNDNINLSSVDFDQLNQNYLRNATRAPFRQLWNNPSEFTSDWDTYFQNHARGEPGATGIGEQKRDAINALLRLDTSVNRDVNPLLGDIRKGFPGTRSIIKSYRIDRASQVTPLEMRSPFTTEEQYFRLNRNYRPMR